MRIQCLTNFIDGRTKFYFDDRITVPDEDGARFCHNGWARDLAGQVDPSPAAAGDSTLNVHDVAIGHASLTI